MSAVGATATATQQTESVVEERQQRLGAQRRHSRRREFERERVAVQPSADRRDRRGVAGIESERMIGLRNAPEKKLDRRTAGCGSRRLFLSRNQQRKQPIDDFAGKADWGLARDQDLQLRSAQQHPLQHRAQCRCQMLDTIEHQQHRSWRQNHGQRR